MVSIRNVPQLVENGFCRFWFLFHFWQKWHISHPTEQGCCFCQLWINQKCATIGRKQFLPILVLPFLAEVAHQSPYKAGVLFLPILDQSEMCHDW